MMKKNIKKTHANVTPEQLRVVSNMLCAALERYHASAALCRRAVWLSAASVALAASVIALKLLCHV